MTLSLPLTASEEAELRELAAQRGTEVQALVLDKVRRLLPTQSAAERLRLLQTLLEDDEEEQRETGEYLRRVLDEDRLANRKLFE